MPPLRPLAKRERNGRRQRARNYQRQAERETKSVAISARRRVHGVHKANAEDPLAETAIGRLLLSLNLPADRRAKLSDAATALLAARRAYDAALDARRLTLARSTAIASTETPDDQAERHRRAIARYETLARTIHATAGAFAWLAITAIAFEEIRADRKSDRNEQMAELAIAALDAIANC